jgi:hypothetical protein
MQRGMHGRQDEKICEVHSVFSVPGFADMGRLRVPLGWILKSHIENVSFYCKVKNSLHDGT